MLANIINGILHLDSYIGLLIENYGLLTYIILFAIIFLETGLVITPFLPGDSLLFVVGAFAAQSSLSLVLLLTLLSAAAILGDTLNYAIGSFFGSKLSSSRLINPLYLEKTKEFYRKYGGKTIILSRFVPIIRTFAPFVAGIGKMHYPKFLTFNIIGGCVWVFLFVLAGYFFGSIPLVKENLTIVILLIIIISIVPIAIEIARSRFRGKA